MPMTLDTESAAWRDPDRIALLSDLHVHADPLKEEGGVNMAAHLRETVRQILAGSTLPDRVIINGDCAHHVGDLADYTHLLAMLDPMIHAGLPLHMGMGNHDRRDHFLKAVEIRRIGHGIAPHASEGRHVLVVPTRRADFVMLDSLDITNAVPGRLGANQLRWLSDLLDARPPSSARPVIVMLHHNPEIMLEVQGTPGNGINDEETRALMNILIPRRQVKAVLFGHTHRWERGLIDGLHLVNLPAVAYVFRPGQPSGWIDCHLTDTGATLTLHSLPATPACPYDIVDLSWRR